MPCELQDSIRPDSDWYTIKQTFIRQATIKSIRCTNEMNGQCEMKGEGINYIQQVSVDNGQTWYPQEPQTLIAQPTPDGQKMAMIPNLINKKLLRIKLRDYPKKAITQSNFTLTNTVKLVKSNAQNPSPQLGAQPGMPSVQIPNQLTVITTGAALPKTPGKTIKTSQGRNKIAGF